MQYNELFNAFLKNANIDSQNAELLNPALQRVISGLYSSLDRLDLIEKSIGNLLTETLNGGQMFEGMAVFAGSQIKNRPRMEWVLVWKYVFNDW